MRTPHLLGWILALLAAFAGFPFPTAAAPKPNVALVIDPKLEPPAQFGLANLESALTQLGLAVQRHETMPSDPAAFHVLAGVASPPGAAVAWLKALNLPVPTAPESLVVHRTQINHRPALILCGTDARGLMYAALDVADQLQSAAPSADPFAAVANATESPYLQERAVSIYTMHRGWFEQRLYDEQHWEHYFDLLARSRINSFVVIFGYENGGFMAPPYPYFFNVPGFPDIELVGLTPEQQQRNTAAFRQIIALAHARGIDFIPAIWDHIYRGGVQGGGIAGASELAGKRVPGLVAGVTAGNLVAYNQAALRRFLEVFPDVDGIQFRMHNESGLQPGEMQGFWHEIFQMIRTQRPDLRVDLRAKELPDAVIADALNQQLQLRVATKYWMEQMGLPFHPTHVNPPNQKDRRHGYADLLRFPQTYPVHWRLWNGGTTRLLLWGDPDYVRRFAHSCRLGGGNSFEVNEMLATWMLGEPHDAPPRDILQPAHRYYEYPFERYWHFYQLWGRLGYNPDTPTTTWQREFTRRFGPDAGPALMRALHLASRVLPRIVAASYPYRYFPTTRGWAEMMRMGDLHEYARAEGSDVEQFLSPRDEARRVLDGTVAARRRPAETSRWFAETAAGITRELALAETAARDTQEHEFVSTAADLKILAALARYHSHRLLAGVAYNLHELASDTAALADAIRHESQAVQAWSDIVQAAGTVYSTNLAFGVHRVGFPRHWQEELQRLRAGLDRLKELYPAPAATPASESPGVSNAPPDVQLERARRAAPGRDLHVTAAVADPDGIKQLRLRYRHLTQFEDYRTAPMTREPLTGLYHAAIPGTFITPEWDLMYYLEAVDNLGHGRLYPDLELEMPYVIVPVDR